MHVIPHLSKTNTWVSNYAPHDSHVWSPLIEAVGEVIVVNPDVKKFERFAEQRSIGLTVLQSQTFEEFVSDLAGKEASQ